MESCPCWLPSTLIIRAQVWDAVQFYSKGWSTPILMWLNLVLIFKSFVKSPVKLQCILHIMVMHINTIMFGVFSSLLTFCYLSLQSTLLTNHLGSSIVFPLPPQRGKVPDHGQRPVGLWLWCTLEVYVCVSSIKISLALLGPQGDGKRVRQLWDLTFKHPPLF